MRVANYLRLQDRTFGLWTGKLLMVQLAPEEFPKGAVLWVEGMAFQFMQTAQTPLAVAVQMGQSASYGLDLCKVPTQRNPRWYRNHPRRFYCERHRSNTRTISSSDLTQPNYNPPTYQGHLGFLPVSTANGIVFGEQILIEMQIMRADGRIVSPWFVEYAAVTTWSYAISAVREWNAEPSIIRDYFGEYCPFRCTEEKWH
ncbi:hypothetical protein P152DRAFT_344026 [Eremomyces bilateralis CBS 781.70]|uniref:Uncharacterized protein n=1 Tax=Eremomyces bilateralis CBS 781.70 TaxID=1392243 RepID=A0A6G1G3L8_9PEZI|nr:uncharacterized protein P152DRAFT_344026 [Eremomyces bilateralis CBS 781.70]KAF1812608.1 hypothetical protein P152DRAFT_344026 [Eremomyces bilateralis CBS 781.70]